MDGVGLKVVVTGSSGRVGRAIFGALAARYDVVGVDRTPFSTTHCVGDFRDPDLVQHALAGADAVVHVASLHAPHVGQVPDAEFHRINVEGTRDLVRRARAAGVRRFVYTSTTALYGHAVRAGGCAWLDENTPPQPATVYHRTKLAAEALLEAEADGDFAVRVLRMSRCFPESPDVMAVQRLHRGIDVRDVARAHAAAVVDRGPAFRRLVVSGWTPFERDDCECLARSPYGVLVRRCPELVREFDARGWSLPATIDRVYSPAAALEALGWRSGFGPIEVLRQYDSRDIEVLPRIDRRVPREGSDD